MPGTVLGVRIHWSPLRSLAQTHHSVSSIPQTPEEFTSVTL